MIVRKGGISVVSIIATEDEYYDGELNQAKKRD